MRIRILAIGRTKGTPFAPLEDLYRDRAAALGRPLGLRALEISEVEDRKTGAGRATRETQRALAERPDGAATIVLDPNGPDASSEALAARLRTALNEGRDLCFMIGGADGFDRAALPDGVERLAFGKATWPHLLARVMLLEQLYRAVSLLAGHPYHRGEP